MNSATPTEERLRAENAGLSLRLAAAEENLHALRMGKGTGEGGEVSAERGERAEFFQRVIDLSPGVVQIFDLRKQCSVFTNRNGMKVLGYSPEEIAAMGENMVPRLMHPDDFGRFPAHIEKLRALGDGEVADFEHRMRDRDGEWQWFHSRDAVFARDESGAVSQLIGTAIKITEKKQTEERLRTSEAEFRATFELSAVGKAQLSAKTGRFIRVNARLCEMTGYSAGELAEMTPSDLDYAEDRAADALVVEPMLRGETSLYDAEKRYVRKDGRIIWVHVSATLLRDAGGEPERAMAVIQDITVQKEAIEALRVSEEFSRTILQSSPDCVKVLDGEGRLQFMNTNGLCAMEIDDFAPFRNQPWWSLWGVENRETIQRAVATALQSGSAHFQAFCATAKGTMKCWDVVVAEVAGSDPKRLVSISRDLTERQQAEEKLRASEERFRAAVGAVGGIIWTNNARGEMEGEQSGWGAFTGQREEEYEGYGWAQAVHPEDAQATIDAWNRAVAEKRCFDFEHRVRRGDGEWRLCSVRAVPVLDDAGEIREWVGVHTDIAERRESEARLRESETRTRVATEATAVGIWEWNVATDTIRWDAQMFRLYGIAPTPDGIVRYADWSGTVFPEDLPETERILQDTVRRQGQSRREFRIVRLDDGECRDLESVETVGMNAQGEVEWVLGTNLDISERKRADEKVRAAKEAAETANAAKDRFLAMLSHELRTPLTPVLMAVGALEQAPGLTREVREDLAMIRRNIELETKLIDDLLDLNRISSGKLAPAIAPVDLNEAVRHVCEICRSSVRERGLRLEMELASDTGLVAADASRLKQVLWNLLKNAIKFTPDRGTIQVSTRRIHAARCEVRVADSGIGIPTDMLPRIFDAFEQGDASVTRQFGGLGLGLAICKALVDLHHGTIRAESAGPGQGSTFILELPGETPAEVAQPAEASPAITAESPLLRILLVEDHQDTARIFSRLLSREGYAVVVASDVASAVAVAERETFDLLISDLGLPDGSGTEVMCKLRTRSTVPGIALSGYGMEEDLRRSREAGFSEHLVKPVDFKKMKEAIRQVTRSNSAS